MPFGLPVWSVLWGMSLALLAASYFAGSAWAARTSIAIFGAYVAVRIFDNLPISGELQIRCFAAIWVAASCFVPLRGAGSRLQPYLIRALMTMAAGCYVWARMTNAPREFGSPPFVASDTLMAAAMLLIGWTLRHDIRSAFDVHSGSWSLGRDSSRGGLRPGSLSNRSHGEEAQATEIIRRASNV